MPQILSFILDISLPHLTKKTAHGAKIGKTEKPHRYLSRDGRVNVERHGWRYWHAQDWYHWLLMQSWGTLLFLMGGLYLILNLLFALIFWSDPGGIANAHPYSFADAFFFSVQTLATIGYGHMFPQSFFSNVAVTAESLISICNYCFLSVLIFSRLSRATARVMFSHHAVIAPFDGAPTLMFRVANKRGNQILQAEVRVSLVRSETTMEGETLRRFYDLKLLRDHSSFFNLTWTVRHRIDESSPLFGATAEQIRESETEIIVLLSGIDDVFGQTVHGRFTYNHEEILFGHRFADMFGRDAHNRPVVDYNKFDEVVMLAGEE